MAKLRVSLSLVLSALALCNAFTIFVPKNNELVYNYSAIVQSGTEIPTSFSSDLYLQGKIHIQPIDNGIKVRFSDLKFYMYNGEAYHNYYANTKGQPLPEEMHDLYKPFQINYDSDGVVDTIVTMTGEKDYVKNMKKAVASIFQMDIHKVSFANHHSFTVMEPSIYGVHKMHYNVVPMDSLVVIHKAHSMQTMNHMFPFTLSNVEPEYCEVVPEHPFHHDMHRTYYVKNTDGQRIVQTIHAFGRFESFPFSARSNTQMMFSNQTFNLEQMKPIEKPMEVENGHTDKTIGYTLYTADEEYENMPDIFLGRRQMNVKSLLPTLYTMFEDVIKYLNRNQIIPEVPDVLHGQMINRIVRFMLYLKYADFEEVYSTLIQKTSEHDKQMMEIFQQILPLVGTRASIIFTKDLIEKNKVKEYMAMEMLYKLPFNVKTPNVKILEDTKDMMSWPNSVSYNIRKAAILSFATLFHKVYNLEKQIHYFAYDKKMDHKENTHGKHSMSELEKEMDMQFLEENPMYVNIIKEMAEKMEKSSDIQMRTVMMGALYNTKLNYALNYLKPLIKDEKNLFTGSMKIYPVLATIYGEVVQNRETVFSLYWPVFTDRTLPVDIRMAAYFAIMETHPPMSLMFNIYWFMQSETNHQLYKFHYDYIKAMSLTTDACHYIQKEHAAAILKYTKPPSYNGFEGFYKMNYFDKKYNFGEDYEMMYVSSEDIHTMVFSYKTEVMNNLYNPLTFMIRVHGLEDPDIKKLFLEHKSTEYLLNPEMAFKMLSKGIKSNSNLKIELAVLRHTQIIHMAMVDGNNLNDLSWMIQLWFQDSIIKKFIDINYEYYRVTLLPNDIGFPAKIETYVPSVKYSTINITKARNEMNVNNYYKHWSHSWNEMTFYNPFGDVWQGVTRLHSMDLAYPIYIDADVTTKSIRINFKRYNDDNRDTIGIRSHAMTMVYVKDDFKHGILEKSCEFCQPWVEVTKVTKKNYTIVDHECNNFGYRTQMLSFDNEIGNPTLKDLKDYLFRTDNKHFMTIFGHMFLSHSHLRSFYSFHPMPLTNGYIMRAIPSKIAPVSDAELNLRYEREVAHDTMVTLPGVKMTLHGSYVVKSVEGAPIKSLVVDSRIDMKPGHKINSYKMQVSYQDPEVGTKIFSVDGSRKYIDDRDTGRMTVAVKHSPDTESTKDDVILDVMMEGKKSEEHLATVEEYGECIPYMLTYPKSYFPNYYMECASQIDAVTDYMYTIKHQNVPEFVNDTLTKALEMSFSIFKFNGEIKKDYVDQNTVKVHVDYPIHGEYVTGQVEEIDSYPLFDYFLDHRQPHDAMLQPQHSLLEVPFSMVTYFGLRPSNLRLSRLYKMMYAIGAVRSCHIYHNSVKINENMTVNHDLTQDWTLYGEHTEIGPKQSFYAKNVGDKIALKVVQGSKTIEVYPAGDNGEHFKVVIDGKVMDSKQIHFSEDSFAVSVQPDFVDILNYEVGINFIYTDHFVHIDIPNHSGPTKGVCFTDKM
ncbi:uncharacterized protein LOC108740701 [Agrilus planipennis]|uniref:Uncharacterized protein LOC108740701 n=1 Tax=Agrilus planipennis TaxID=224129 RepID=A0A1W4XCW0_AGRPL|nr:uncharacterized protein LOC108740701 [Agrilus planipennis]